MTNPAYVSNVNLLFRGPMTDVVVLLSGTPKTVVRFDTLDSVGRNHVDELAQGNGLFHQLSGFSNIQTAVQGVPATAATPGYQFVNFSSPIHGADSTGLKNDATIYTADITVDAVVHHITIVGSANQTFTALIATITAGLGGAGTAFITSGAIQVISASTGVASTVYIVDVGANHLFYSLNNNKSISLPVNGVAAVGATAGYQVVAFNPAAVGGNSSGLSGDASTAGTLKIAFTAAVAFVPATTLAIAGGMYNFRLAIDGGPEVIYTVTATGVDTMTSMAALMQTAVQVKYATATVTAVSNYWLVTSGTTSSLSMVVGVHPAEGTKPDLIDAVDTAKTATFSFIEIDGTGTTYNTNITIDGTVYPVAALGNTNQTFTTVLATINAALGGNGTAAIVGNNIKITSATTGVASSVSIDDRVMPLTSANVMYNTKIDNGLSWYDTYADQTEFLYSAPLSQADKRALFGITTTDFFVYWDGTNYRHILSDTIVV